MNGCVKRSIVSQKVEALPLWLNTSERFSTIDSEGNVPPHLFFDLASFHQISDNGINYVMTSPKGGNYGYDLDLHSGRLYKKHDYCEHKDVWKSYEGTIHRPPFSIGFVPRLLDQLGRPQKILVFGDTKYFQKFSPRNNFSQRARIVGGYVEQYCKNFPCKSRQKWMSRLVLLAVNSGDPEFKSVFELEDLKKKVDWDYVKGFVENGEGRKIIGKKEFPAYRMVGEINATKAFSFALTKGHLFKFKEMKSLAKSCRKLYDYTWKNANSFRKEEKDENASFLNFSEFFKDFHSKYNDRYKTCQKYVKTSNINNDVERHWFFNMFSAFHNAEKLGFVYNCASLSWIKNPLNSKGKPLYNAKKMLKSCTPYQLDRSFESAINLVSGLARVNQAHYRYIEYDNFRGSSHEKLHSWVFDSGKKISCAPKYDTEMNSIFPKDVSWKPFAKKRLSRDDYIR